MATILSSPTSMTLSAPGASVFAQLAASMPAGTWAQVAGTNQNSVLTDNDGAGSGGHLHYSNSMNYIAQSDRIQIVAADHGSYSAMGIFEYDLATNQFVTVNAPSKGGDSTGAGPGHGFDHAAVNPHTGDAYQVIYGNQSGQQYKFKVTKRSFGGSTFSSSLPVTMIDQAVNITFGSCWWSGSFTGGGGAGAHGCLMVYNVGNCNGSATDGVVSAFDPLRNTWFYGKVGASPFYVSDSGTYHNVAEYSAKLNCMVYGGGNAAGRKLWRMDSNGAVTRLTDVPSGKGVGIQRGNLVCDPVSGKFLLFSNYELWELDPTGSGTWTQQAGSRVPPAGIGNPGPYPAPQDGIMSCALPRYGVLAYIKQSVVNGGTFFLYKHA